MSLAIISHPVFESHAVPDGHPERPGRITSAWSALESVEQGVVRVEAPRVNDVQLARVHTARHIDFVRATAPQDGIAELDHETTMGPQSLEAFERAAGGVCHAVDLALSQTHRRTFVAARPPGHHARADHVAGFCIFNNVAVGAAHALAQPGIERVAIFDFDVHHGDGTESMFREDPRVLMGSTYQHPLYPDVNLPSVPGSQINMPLPAGTDGETFQRTVSEQWLPSVAAFAPDFVFVSAGFDAHVDDPLGSLCLTTDDFAWATCEMMTLAERFCDGRICVVMEGGYNLQAVGSSARCVVDAMNTFNA
ncbi:MAG: histone deacetylase family protein [Pseudomonadota bacterium]